MIVVAGMDMKNKKLKENKYEKTIVFACLALVALTSCNKKDGT